MCELLLVRSEEAFRLEFTWELVERLERFGIAGFSWGAAWLDARGRLAVHRSTCAFRDDPAREGVGANESTVLLVHLRRPTRLGTVGPADTQPFLDPRGRFAFAHNGGFARHGPVREDLKAQGRIHGLADSEVGQRLLEDAWQLTVPSDALEGLHEALGGSANLMTLEPSGRATAYAANPENPLFRFRLGSWRVVASGIHSIDRSLFRLVAPAARERHVVPSGTSVTIA